MRRTQKGKKIGSSHLATPTVLSLYTGAGGLDLGLEAAGFRHLICVESDPDARETLRLNRPNWKLAIPGDIHRLSTSALLRQAGVRRRELALLAGGPPCQPFSKAGYWASGDSRRLNDPRSSTIGAYFDVVESALPMAFLIENVKGFSFKGKDEAFELSLTRVAAINRKHGTNYRPFLVALNAANYGVPQVRERVFVIAHREGRQLALPEPTHALRSEPPEVRNRLRPALTAYDAIGDLDIDIWPKELRATGKWAGLLPSIPEGNNYLWHTARGGGLELFGWRTRYWSFLLKLAKDLPAWTIPAEPGPATGPFHWKSRRLSTRELCRLQTFPDDYEIFGDYRSAHRQIGNAVPSLIGEFLGLEIRRQLLGHRVRKTLKLVIAPTKATRRAERIRPVPKQYHSLVKKYKAHPGHGLGPGAKKRLATAEKP